jgi:hypothetical protein
MSNQEKPAVEGEGSYTATRAYNKHTQETVRSGTVEQKAQDAAKAVEGPEAAELKRAEEAGKKHSHGEDPKLARKPA